MAFEFDFKIDGQALDAEDNYLGNLAFAINPILGLVLDNVTTTNQDNLIKDFFTSDNAQAYQWMEYDAGSDYYKTFDSSAISSDFYVDIYTTSTTGISAISGVNNCETVLISYDGTTYIYRMYCTTGTAAVQRAQVYKTLFYGTDGSDYKVTGITGITNLKTSESNDVGKRAHLARNFRAQANATGNAQYLGTFANTSTNTDCQVWTFCSAVITGGGGSASVDIQFPNATTINSASVSGPSSSSTNDETGTDTSGDNLDNPADIELNTSFTISGGTPGGTTRALILCVGDISWGATTGGTNPGTQDNQDFNSDHSIPDFEAITFSDTDAFVVTQTYSFTNPTAIISKWLETVDASNTLTVQFSADGGSNYQTITNKSQFYQITNTGSTGQFKLVFTRTDDTTVDYVEKIVGYYG